MTTEIISNGSKWAGSDPDPIEVLFDVLANHPLDPRMTHSGEWKGRVQFGGNFVTVSHVFNILTDDEPTIAALTAAIATNRETDAYKQFANEICHTRCEQPYAVCTC